MSTVKKIPEGFHAITPYLAVKDAEAAIRFYQQAFGAKETGRISMPDGTVGHAELQIGDSKIMLAEEIPAWGNTSPVTLGGSPVSIALYVDDADDVFKRALDAGATEIEPMKDQLYGDRSGLLADPFGHKWYVMTHIEDIPLPEIQKRFDAMFATN